MGNTFKSPCDEGILQSGGATAPCVESAAPWILAATILGSSMAFIDGTVVNVALPALQQSLNATVMDMQWVVEDGLDQQQRSEFFIPYGRSPSGGVIFTVRTAIDPNGLIPSLKSAIWEVDPKLPFYRVTTMEQLIDDSLTERRFHLILLGTFAGVAMLLCALGIYGLISFMTAQRTNEIGIRVVLGAQKSHIWKMITGHGVRLALAGIAAGIVGAFWLTRYLRSLLFEIRPLDPFTYFAAVVVLLGVVVVACLLPARRAMRIDPIAALRYE